ncbi:fimbria/pilus chaperone family protein [Pseudomonas fontis]|uniref:Fimbria/pilus chaperone family protein n=1 Tax=Pseudomonas fontis TaxID=2942633 RepID=A0ABT5NZ62_9PSED|nr:fimbria/pilus chaperone family protein [Pseudomonas fontis]MDD0977577.1 fimbria/pilus chaperone family protein [Pseudomonas fontis]MDD0993445.1 fimbria/pilus chaperone family protein [Pseudomonas fontis]
MHSTLARCCLVISLFAPWSPVGLAAGMLPETSVLLINAADGEGSITVTNSESEVALLHTSLDNLAEDTEELLFVTTPIARVEPGEKQLVRFIVQSDTPITTQRMKRVIFEGIPPAKDGRNAIRMNVRQNLPVIINPAGLASMNDPWTLLKWSVEGGSLVVRNDSPYVVRLGNQLLLLPAQLSVQLPRTYVLPGQVHTVELPVGFNVVANSKVRLFPVSLYGFQVDAYDAPVSAR